jgi:hypothetical protein
MIGTVSIRGKTTTRATLLPNVRYEWFLKYVVEKGVALQGNKSMTAALGRVVHRQGGVRFPTCLILKSKTRACSETCSACYIDRWNDASHATLQYTGRKDGRDSRQVESPPRHSNTEYKQSFAHWTLNVPDV